MKNIDPGFAVFIGAVIGLVCGLVLASPPDGSPSVKETPQELFNTCVRERMGWTSSPEALNACGVIKGCNVQQPQ